GYSALKTALEAENFTVQTLILPQTAAIPADCAVLIVAGPTHAMLPAEVTTVQNYMQAGGHTLFLLNAETQGPLVNYLEGSLDVRLTRDVILDPGLGGRLFNGYPT